MNEICKTEKLIQPNFFQRLLKIKPKENAFIEVNNHFASKPLREIKFEEIVAISERYKVDLRENFNDKLKELYLIYLKQCFYDSSLSEQELDNLNHLKNLLALQNYEIEKLHNKLASEIYKETYNEAIIDGKISESEKIFLNKLRENLRLPTNLEEKISIECRQGFIQMKLDTILSDNQISPDEWEEFNAIAKSLNIDLEFNEVSKEQIEKLKLYWFIENGELPIKEVSIDLQKDEHCYLNTSADWLESRTITKRENFSGPYAQIRIMKGIYYRAGSIAFDKVTTDQLQLIDSGEVYITNKRVIFIGKRKKSDIQLHKILSLTPFSNGVGIEKDSGKSPIITIKEEPEILVMTLSRVINDLQNTM